MESTKGKTSISKEPAINYKWPLVKENVTITEREMIERIFSPTVRKNMRKCTCQQFLMTQAIPPVISTHFR